MTVTTTGPRSALVAELADRLQRRGEPRHADREAGRRHVLAAEAADQAVIAPSPADRAEDDGLALLVGHLERELRLEDGAGVVFEAADDGGIDPNSADSNTRSWPVDDLTSSLMPRAEGRVTDQSSLSEHQADSVDEAPRTVVA